MKTLALAFTSILLGSLAAQDVSAQPVRDDRRVEIYVVQPGAGGRGGAGGGVSGEGFAVGAVCGSNSPTPRLRPGEIDRRVAAPPPMDPTRKILTVSCTEPFVTAGGGNLCCS